MEWSAAQDVLAEAKTPSGYRLAQLRRDEVPELVRKLRDWYPDIAVGAESCHLSSAFYYQCSLAGEPGDRSVLPIVAKRDDELVALLTLEKSSAALTITSRMGAVDPVHRGSGLALLGPLLLEKVGRAIGAEMAYYFATLKSAHQQVLAERLRFLLVGIVPAHDRDMIRPGEVKRVYEAIYAKVLVDPGTVAQPDASALTPKTKAVWQALFGSACHDGVASVSTDSGDDPP